MSPNYTLYMSKTAEARARRAIDRPLQSQLNELFLFVMLCEARWA